MSKLSGHATQNPKSPRLQHHPFPDPHLWLYEASHTGSLKKKEKSRTWLMEYLVWYVDVGSDCPPKMDISCLWNWPRETATKDHLPNGCSLWTSRPREEYIYGNVSKWIGQLVRGLGRKRLEFFREKSLH